MSEKLSDQARADELPALLNNGWEMVEGRDAIVKTFTFRNFIDAMGWMMRAAIWAEKWRHHPEWANIWNKTTVTLTTHDVDGLSELDIKLARKLDALSDHN